MDLPNLSDIKNERLKHRACIKIVKWWFAHRLRRNSSSGSLTTHFELISSKMSYKKSLSKSRNQTLDFDSLSDSSYSDDENDAFMDFRRTKEESAVLAKESFQTMVENEKLGDMLIVERCYIFVGTNEKVHSLLFRSLQQLIDSERDVSILYI